MTIALEIIAKIRSSGGSIWSEHGDLLIEAEPGILTADDTEILRRSKSELIPILDRPIPQEDPVEREAIVWSESAPRAEVDHALNESLTEWDQIIRQDTIQTGGTTFSAIKEEREIANLSSADNSTDTLLSDGPTSSMGCEISEESEISPKDTVFTGSFATDMGCEISEESEISPITIRAEHTPDGLVLHCPPEIAAGIEAGRDELETILNAGDQDDNRYQEVEPIACEKCDGGIAFELWEDLTGRWRCRKHDPPHKAQMLRLYAAQIRRRSYINHQGVRPCTKK